MRRKKISKEVEGSIEQLVQKRLSSRKIAKQINAKYSFLGIKINHVYVWRNFIAPKQKGERLKEIYAPKRESLTLNIETRILEQARRKIEWSNGKADLNDIVNETLHRWLREHEEGAVEHLFVELNKYADQFEDRRRKYREAVKKTIAIEKTILRRLKDIQTQISEGMLEPDFLVQLVRPNSKMTLEDWVYTMRQQGLLKTGKNKGGNIISIAVIINIVLRLELL